MITVKEITCDVKKQEIAREVLEALTDWFEIPQYREEYIVNSAGKYFFAAMEDEKPIGFLYLKETGKSTVELAVMGIKKEFHRQGLGKALFDAAKERASALHYEFMQVKTVQMGFYPEYDDTNRFYLALGFKELEVIPIIWGPENPCQIYIMSL